MRPRNPVRLILVLALSARAAPSLAECRFEISFPASVRAEPVTGRVYVMISRTNEKEPRFQIGRTGVPSSAETSRGFDPASSRSRQSLTRPISAHRSRP